MILRSSISLACHHNLAIACYESNVLSIYWPLTEESCARHVKVFSVNSFNKLAGLDKGSEISLAPKVLLADLRLEVLNLSLSILPIHFGSNFQYLSGKKSVNTLPRVRMKWKIHPSSRQCIITIRQQGFSD